MKSIGRMTSHGVEDGRAASRLRSGVHIMGAALGLLLASPTFAATANGSRICASDRSTISGVGIDASHTLTDNNAKIIYAAGVNDGGNRFQTGHTHSLQYRELPSGTFADVPLSNASGPFIAATGTALTDNTVVSPGTRRCNLLGDGNYLGSAKEFQGANSHNYSQEVRDDRTEGQWALDFSNDPGLKTYEFQVRWGSNDGDQFITYPAQITTTGVGPTITISDHASGQETDAFSESGSETNAELFGINLNPGADTITVTQLVFQISAITGLTNSDWAGVEVVIDNNSNGSISPGETTKVGGAGTVNQAAGTITFSTSFSVSVATNYILRADFASLSDDDTVSIVLNPADITTTAAVTGSTSAVTHVELTVTGGFSWLTAALDVSLGTTGSWQDVDLSGSVPVGATGAVIEISNTNTGSVLRGVLRAKGDTRDYMSNPGFNKISETAHRYQIVKLDASRLAEGWINNVAVKFRLLGYTTGTDTSYFTAPPQITFTAGAWTTVDVSSQVDADADGVVLFIQNEDSANRTYGMRELTSSDITLSMRNERSRMQLVGLDAAKKFDAYIQTTGVKVYLVGQTKGSVVYYTNNVAVTDPILNSWQPLDADDYAVAAEANGLVLSVWISGSVTNIGFRHGDSTDDFPGRKLNGSQSFQAAVGLNALNEWGEYMGNTGVDVSIAAYTKGSGGGNWMATGTYTGNSPSNQSITGLDFQPDVVFVKRYPNKNAHCRTSTMTGDESKRFTGSNLITDTITLDTDGFTVSGTAGPDDFVNQSSEPFHWIAFKATAGLCEVGSYSGTGSSWTVPVAFQPNYVIVMAENGQHPFHRSSEMPADQGAKMEGSGLSTERIKALLPGGFEVGTNSAVNSGGTTYHFVAWKAVANQMEVGSYPGNSSDTDIAVTFQPKWVIVQASASVSVGDGSPGTVHRPDTMTGDVSINFNWAYSTTVFDNCIKALQTTGFKVGTNQVVNQTGKTYYWMAFGESASGPAPKPKILKWVEVDPYGP